MSSTPPRNNNPNQPANISESWVDLTGQVSPTRVTPVPFGGLQDYERMLREAQRESNRSSAKVSPISSAIMSLSSTTRNTPSASPKSPPNSPNPELASIAEDFKGVYINKLEDKNVKGQPVTASELIWDWTSRPNVPPREWKLVTSATTSNASSSNSSSNEADAKKKPGFSKGILFTLILTNFFSLLIGAGIGMWLSKKSGNHGMIDIPI